MRDSGSSRVGNNELNGNVGLYLAIETEHLSGWSGISFIVNELFTLINGMNIFELFNDSLVFRDMIFNWEISLGLF